MTERPVTRRHHRTKPAKAERPILTLLESYYVESAGIWATPTAIARALHPGTPKGSEWSSPICTRMTGMGWLERSDIGHYRITEEGRHALHGGVIGPDVPTARKVAERYEADMVVIYFVKKGVHGYSSYGRNAQFCRTARRLGDEFYNAVARNGLPDSR